MNNSDTEDNNNLRNYYDNIGESARNRFGRPYISGRPLLNCDRYQIIFMYNNGIKKINIARQLGITHSCVSKVINKYVKTGIIVQDKQSRTASCACPSYSVYHNPYICRHYRYYNNYYSSSNTQKNCPESDEPIKFSIKW